MLGWLRQNFQARYCYGATGSNFWFCTCRNFHPDLIKLRSFKRLKGLEIERLQLQRVILQRILNALAGENSYDGAMQKLEGLNVHLSSSTVVQVLKKVPVHSGWAFFCWAKNQNGFSHDKQTYIAMMISFGNNEMSDLVKLLLEDMKNDGHEMNLATYRSVMRAYTNSQNFKEVLDIWDVMRQTGCQADVEAYNLAIHSFLKEKQHQAALQTYRDMLQLHQCPNAYTYHYLITSLIDAAKLEGAYLIVKKMPNLGVRPMEPTYSSLVKACLKANESEKAADLLLHMKETSRTPKISLVLAVHKALALVGKSTNSLEQAWPSCYALSGTQLGAKSDDDDDVLFAADKLKSWGPGAISALESLNVKWNENVATDVLKKMTSVDVAWGFFEWLRNQEGYEHSVKTYKMMIFSLLDSRKFHLVHSLLDEMRERNIEVPVRLLNRFIFGYCSNHDVLGALKVYGKMADLGCQPSDITFTTLIKILMRSRQYEQAMVIYGHMLQSGYQPNNYTYTVLIHGLGLAGKAEAGHKLFNIMLRHGFKPNVITYTALMGAYGRMKRVSDVTDLFSRMQAAGMRPTPITYKVLVQTFAKAGQMLEAKEMEERRQILVSSGIAQAVLEENRVSVCNHLLTTIQELALSSPMDGNFLSDSS